MTRVLITGGTGSFGKEFIKTLLSGNGPSVERLVVFSRDELKQWELRQLFPSDKFPQLRLFLGDIRDRERLKTALRGIDTVVHAAALKQVPAAEYNPIEFINTNVLGSENIVQACLESDVTRVVALSTDKAASPINLYGATKLCSDKLFIAANNIKGWKDITFSVVRYGNVMGSRGSVIPYFLDKAKDKILPLTDPNMTRFNISLRESVEMVLWSLKYSVGGEILVPKIPSYKLSDLAEAISPSSKVNIVGVRPGEKLHEEMITLADSYNTVDIGKFYSIISPWSDINLYKENGLNPIPMSPYASYNSLDNHYLSVKEIRDLIVEHIDPSFLPI